MTGAALLTELSHRVFYPRGSICLIDCTLLKLCPENRITDSPDNLFFAAYHYNIWGLHKLLFRATEIIHLLQVGK